MRDGAGQPVPSSHTMARHAACRGQLREVADAGHRGVVLSREDAAAGV